MKLTPNTGGPTDQVPLYLYDRAKKIHRSVKKAGHLFDKLFTFTGYAAITIWTGWILWLAWTTGLGWIIIGVAVGSLLIYAIYWYNVSVVNVLRKGKENGVIDE